MSEQEHIEPRPSVDQSGNQAPPHEPRTGARHRVSIGHLVMGVALLGLAAVWALVVSGTVEGADIRFLLPAPWILAGAAGLVALVSSDRRALAAQRSGTLEA